MRRALVLVAKGFEEIETVTPIDVLRRAGVEVVVAGLSGAGPVVGARGIAIACDVDLEEVGRHPRDLVYVPGGAEGAMRLASDPRVGDVLREQRERGGVIAAICAATTVLHAHGVLSAGARVTSHPSVRAELTDYDYDESPVVVDGAIVTSRGAGTAMALALVLVERLVDRATRESVAGAMLASAE